MKETDLRIGNLVSHKYDGIIKGWQHHEISHEDIYSLGCGSLRYKPILITEDWLLRFGFEKDGECEHEYTEYYYSKSVIIGQSNHSERIRIILPSNHCEIGDTMDDMMYLLNISIDYVHQLQNLYYCLTGEELKYEK